MCQPMEPGGTSPRRSFLKQGVALLTAGSIGTKGWAARLLRAAGTDIAFESTVGDVRGYLAVPGGKHRHPPVIVMHGNVGQPDYQRRIADELAGAGFVALAIERFSRIPNFTWDTLREDDRSEKRFLSETYFREEEEEALGAVNFLRRHPRVRNSRMGAVGFCGGGIHAVRLSITTPAIGAVVSFYGPPELPQQYRHPTDPIINLVQVGSQVKAPLQMHYGTGDYVVKAEGVDRLAAQARRSGAEVEVYSYEGALHGFYQTPRPADAAAAALARDRYIGFLRRHLG